MTYWLTLVLPITLAALTACSPPAKDYESARACVDKGIKADAPEFEECVQDERAARMLAEQRQEYEQRKAEEEYWRSRRPY